MANFAPIRSPVQDDFGHITRAWASYFESVDRLLAAATSPVTVTAATYTVATKDRDIIANRAGTVTLTLPSAAPAGRRLNVKTIQAQQVDSASANVVPRAGGAAGTAILGASDGAWAELVSNGTSWEVMAGS